MKPFKIILTLALLALVPMGAKAAGEIDYQSVTLYTIPSAFPTASASNILGVVNLTKQDQFLFTVSFIPNVTSAQGANNLDVRWSVSPDGVNWPAAGIDKAANQGWFSIPVTNNTGQVTWSTNITVNTLGYWRFDWLTNGHSGSITSGTAKAFFKPQRSGNNE